MDESGQTREVVAYAIKQAVEAEQEQAMKSGKEAQAAFVQARIDQCKPIMDAQLVAADAATKSCTNLRHPNDADAATPVGNPRS